MSEERDDGPPTGNTPSDLRTLIADTLAEQTKEPAGGERGPPPADEGAPPGEERQLPLEPPARSPGEPGGGGERPPPAEGGEEPPEDAGEPPAEAAAGTAAPQHWAAADKAKFAALPADAKAPFLDLYKRMERGFQPRLERVAALEKDFAEIDQLFEPHRERLRAQGRGPKEILQIWYNTEALLADQRTRDEVIANLIHGYGGDPANIARHLNQRRGFAATPGASDRSSAPPNGGYQTEVSPDLSSRLAALETVERQRLETEARANLTTARTVYEDFANARDAQGSLLHPYLTELEPQMTALAQLDRAQGKQIDLQDLYTRAAWMTDSTRDRLLGEHQQTEQRRAADERKAKADAARRAGSSVTGSAGPGAAPQDLGASDRSIRDEIRAQMNGNGRNGGRI